MLEISEQWDSIELHNSGLSQRIETRRDSANTDMDRDAITAERRMLCIQLEILTSIESPSEDRALRLQYQLQQMNQSGLSQSAIDDDKQLIVDMELNWLCMPGAKAEQQVALDKRFQRVLTQKEPSIIRVKGKLWAAVLFLTANLASREENLAPCAYSNSRYPVVTVI